MVAEAARRAQPADEAEGFEAIIGRGVRATVGGQVVLVGSGEFLIEAGVGAANLPPLAVPGTAAARTTVFVAADAVALGAIDIDDPIKPGAAEAVRALHQAGLTVHLLSGDTPAAAQAVAASVGIESVRAAVRPADKAAHVKALQAAGHVVAMVGDGINDAPALAQADVGIAIGSGTDVAIEASDITLIGGDPRLVASAIALSRRTLRVIRENLAWAFGYNVVLIPVAMGLFYPFFGLRLDPMLAAAAMAFSSVSVVLNSLRLRGSTPPAGRRP